MSDRAPYSRVYHSIVDDPKFATVYDNDRLLATWLRLLIVAEQAHPASAYIPAGAHRASVIALSDAGLIDLGTGSRFRVHGLDAERTRRSEAARVGGLASARSRSVERPFNDRSTTVDQTVSKRGTASQLDETSKDETRRAEPSNGRADAMDTYWTLLGVYPNGRSKEWLQELINEFDDRRVSDAIAAESRGDRQGLLSRVRDRLRSEADKAAKAKAAADTKRLEDEAAAKRITPEQAAENKRLIDLELQRMVKR